MINKKILNLIYLFFMIVFLYFIFASSGGTLIWISFIALIGFYCSLYFKGCVVFSSLISCCLCIIFVKDSPFMLFLACIIFISLIPFPYYINAKIEKAKKSLTLKRGILKEQYKNTFLEYKKSIKTKQEYEKEMSRVSKLYSLDAKLSEVASKKEYVDLIMSFFSQDYGIFGGAILEKVSSGWKKLSTFGILKSKDLSSFIKHISVSNNGTTYSAIDNNEFNKKYFSILYCPMLAENDILGCIFIIIKKDLEAIYIKDAPIFSSHFALGFKRVTFFDEIRQKARIDSLTGLLLRSYFLEKVKFETQKINIIDYSFYILMLDLDNFKNINDKYGHLTGDKTLVEIAKVVLSCIGNNGLVGRYGGDEFIIFLSNTTEKEVLFIANKINKSLKSKLFEEDNEKFNVTASIGISCMAKII
ncbi:MAG: GGDEF domain-containing protein [Endomicrobium sp.]|jgi:diguanylate cyclase (GGDEF)-like protein|nr:GGDEF domain-containing protein [Endomicrobium sp.]